MDSAEFRKELIKIMPGYKWTVHRPHTLIKRFLSATGIKTSGFNRVSTLNIIRREKDDYAEYEIKSAGFGKNASWLFKIKPDICIPEQLQRICMQAPDNESEVSPQILQ